MKSKRAKHGHRGPLRTPTYHTWNAMRQRCGNPKHKSWTDYGGRGIVVTERWKLFKNFLEDMGERPKGHTLDRIDYNGPYVLENCRWATSKEQRANQRRTEVAPNLLDEEVRFP